MPIEVTCPGCKAIFRVSEKFAGQKGPCPKCKAVIQIPEKEEQVVIHAPEREMPKGITGKHVFRPIRRKETKVSTPLTLGVVAAAIVVLVVSLLLRSSVAGAEQIPGWARAILALGALALGPALAVGGYTFLRDAELDPYRGGELWLRVAICGAVYALLWGVYVFLKGYLFADVEMQPFHYLFLIPPFLLVGGLAGFASLDLDYSIGVIHYGLYLLVTLGLCLIIGVPLR